MEARRNEKKKRRGTKAVHPETYARVRTRGPHESRLLWALTKFRTASTFEKVSIACDN